MSDERQRVIAERFSRLRKLDEAREPADWANVVHRSTQPTEASAGRPVRRGWRGLGGVAAVVGALAVAAVLFIAGLQGNQRSPATPDSPGRVVLRAEPTGTTQVNPESLSRTVSALRDRANRLGLADFEAVPEGTDRIVLTVPQSTSDVVRALTASSFSIYAYEPNLVGRTRGEVRGPRNPSPDVYDLIRLAHEERPSGVGSTGALYLFRNDNAHTFIAGPGATREELLAGLRGRPETTPVAVEVEANPAAFDLQTLPEGFTLLAEPGGSPLEPGKTCGQAGLTCVLLRDDAGVTGRDVEEARMGQDLGGDPSVDILLRGSGREGFATTTRDLVQRSRSEGREGTKSFVLAIALDGVILSKPYVDPIENPDGIDSDRVQISQEGVTDRASAIVDRINSGGLPLRLRPLTRP